MKHQVGDLASATEPQDEFDAMRTLRTLAPHDRELNDRRWLIGEALRRLHRRANSDTLRSDAQAIETVLRYHDELRAAEISVGRAAWPVLKCVVIEGGQPRECRDLVPEASAPARADLIIIDRLRVALDRLGPLLGVTSAT